MHMATVKDMTKAVTDGNGGTMAAGNTLKSLINSATIKARFEEVLGEKAAAFLSSVLSATATNKALTACDPTSVLSAAMVAATLDLPINQSLGFAYIVPYGGKAQFQMGYKGFVQLAMRTGQYRTMNVTEVYEGEIKSWDKFTGIMEFDQNGKKSDTIVGYLFFYELVNGFRKWTYMTKEAALAHGKRYSQSFSKPNSRWATDFDSMAKKTVIKAGLSKWGIMDTKLQKAITYDAAAVSEDLKPEYVDSTAEHTDAPAEETNEAPSADTTETNTAWPK